MHKLTVACCSAVFSLTLFAQGPGSTGVTVFEGARLITGNDGPPIENSAFIVQNGQFTQVGERGKLRVPAGAVHVDLTGKTVMPGKVDLHGHIGYQHDVDGTMAKEFYTRENLIDHLQRLAYYGFSAVISIGDLEDRSDLGHSDGKPGRTNWGDVPLQCGTRSFPARRCFARQGPESPGPDRAPTDIPPEPMCPIR